MTKHLGTPHILGLDPSLTSTGVAYPDGTVTTWRTATTGEKRLAWLQDQLNGALYGPPPCPDLVVVEGYSYASANQAHQVGEWGGVLRLTLYDSGIPYVEVPPSTLKFYATGHGNAGKPEMVAAAIRRLGYDGHSDDEADALWLREMGVDRYNGPDTPAHVPQSHRVALDRIAWPELTS